MKVLVTGSSGFLGYHLVANLKALQVPVTGTVFQRPALSVSDVRLDITSAEECGQVLRDHSPTHVIHTAALSQTGECQQFSDRAHAINVKGTQNLLHACETLPDPPHFVHISTDLVFDGTDKWYTETVATIPIQVYGKTKLQAEQLLPHYRGAWALVRSALIYGPAAGARECFLQWMLKDLREGSGAFFEDEFRTPVYVADLCDLLIAICRSGATGLFHAGGCDRLSRFEFAGQVAEVAGLTIYESQRSTRISKGLETVRPRDVSLDSHKAMRDLNWKPATVSDALKKILTRKS